MQLDADAPTRVDATLTESSRTRTDSVNVGTTLGGHYRVEKMLGAGGSGVVYQVEHTHLGKRFALKLLHSSEPRDMQRLVNEARVVAALRHPNVVDVSDFGHTDDGDPFMVMELLEGESLSQVIRVAAPMSRDRAVRIALQILAALSAAHERGVVHRDIKPGNCFRLTNAQGEDVIKVLDFGIAALRSSQVPHTKPVSDAGITGTLEYMSPEQASGEPVDHRSDIYSVAVVLYELLVGKPPFHGFTAERLLYHQVYESPPPPSQANPSADVTAELEAVLLRALAKEPSDRFGSAAEFSAALHRCVDVHDSPRSSRREQVLADELSEDLAILAGRVKRFWVDGALHQDLDEHPIADLEYTVDYSLVENPWEGTFARPARTPRPQRTPVVQTFFELGRTMLIVGAPGAGKTFMMLGVVEALLSRLEHDPNCGLPVPVVFALSTWSGRDRDLVTWMVDELRSKYHVPAALGRTLIERRKIMPFLDGLDDVHKRHRRSCVKAINAYIESPGASGCVVCCQREVYDTVEPLRLAAAVCIQPLDDEQLRRYLAQATDTEHDLDQLMDASVNLGELTRNPLMLRMLVTAQTTGQWPAGGGSLADRRVREQFVRQFVTQALTRPGKQALRWTQNEVRRALAWLAAGMRGHQQTVFTWEEIQPSWLRHWAGYVMVASGLSALLFGASFILGFGLTPFENAGLKADLTFGATFGLTAAAVVWIYYGGWNVWRFARPRAKPVSPSKLARIGAALLATGVTGGALCALLVPQYGPGVMPLAIEAALFGALVFGDPMLRRAPDHDIQTRETIRWSWRGAGTWGSTIVGATMLIGGGVALFENAVAGLSVGATTFVGGLLLSAARRKRIDPESTPNHGIHSTLLQALRIAGLVGTLMAVPASASYGIGYGLCVGLTFAILALLRFGGDDVLRHYILRLTLHRQQHLPRDLPDMFDAAADRQVLRRIGGGYMFAHGQLMDVLVDDAA